MQTSKIKLAIMAAAIGFGGAAMAASDYSSTPDRDTRMNESLSTYRSQHPSNTMATGTDSRNPNPGRFARAEDATKRGAHRAGAAIKRGAHKVGDAVSNGAEKTGDAIQRTGDRIKNASNSNSSTTTTTTQ